MIDARLFDRIPSQVWHIDWNVNSQAVPSSEACRKYVAPYVFKVAISNSRIMKVEDCTVLICYKKPHSNRLRTLPLEVMEFIRRFLQHVLPTGFMKVRYYGFMNPNCKLPAVLSLGLGLCLYFSMPASSTFAARDLIIQATAPETRCDGKKGNEDGVEVKLHVFVSAVCVPPLSHDAGQ